MTLEGDYDASELDEITGLLIKHFKRCDVPTNRQGITAEEFVAKIRNWMESTTTSPSGIHLGHYHALIARHCHKDSPSSPECELLDAHQEALIYAHVSLINYALRMGISYDRWKTVVNIMLEKDPGDPKIHRLRVINIYEADYNLLLSIQWRNLMHLAEDHHLLNEGQYGSRPHRNAHDPVFIEEMQFEVCRASRKPLVKSVRYADLAPALLEHMRNKYDWTEETKDRIDWTANGQAIHRNFDQKTHNTKLVHDILPTNHRVHRYDKTRSAKCPLCKHLDEDRDHIL